MILRYFYLLSISQNDIHFRLIPKISLSIESIYFYSSIASVAPIFLRFPRPKSSVPLISLLLDFIDLVTIAWLSRTLLTGIFSDNDMIRAFDRGGAGAKDNEDRVRVSVAIASY